MLGLTALLALPVAYMQERKAPDITLSDINGKEQKISALRGKVTLVDQWATWCGPCKKEIPELIKLQKKYGDKLAIIGISYDDDQNTVKEFLNKDQTGRQINYSIVFGPSLKGNGFAEPEGLPTMIIIDKKGTIRAEQVGTVSFEELDNAVGQLIAE
jgi:thiol-disulfide isomerase/thioredoxin